MSRNVIIAGAEISDYRRLKKYFRPDDYVTYCDCGLFHMEGLGVKPDLIVGDFDSYENPHMNVETIVLPCEKDDTDTVYAVKEGIKRGYRDFLLLGAVGQRLDHTLANVYILNMLDCQGLKGKITDDYSEMEIVSGEKVYVDDTYAFFSLLNITGTAKNITITGAKYPLEKGQINCDYQYGVSNEVLPGHTAEISVGEGQVLLIKVFRKDK